MNYNYKFSSRYSRVDDLKTRLKEEEQQLFKEVINQIQETDIDFDGTVCCTIHRTSDESSIYAAIHGISRLGVSNIISFDAYEYEGEYVPSVELDDFMAGELNFLTEIILQMESEGKLHFKDDGQD